MEDDVADAFSEAGEECNISNEDMKRIWNAAVDAAAERIDELITDLIVSGIDSDDDFEKHKASEDELYKNLEIVPDMHLFDNAGYLYGTVKSVDGDTVTVALADPIDPEETSEPQENGGKKEVTMSLDEVRSFTISLPAPVSTEYRCGKKIEHFMYSGVDTPHG